jgi:hypothetical protein
MFLIYLRDIYGPKVERVLTLFSKHRQSYLGTNNPVNKQRLDFMRDMIIFSLLIFVEPADPLVVLLFAMEALAQQADELVGPDLTALEAKGFAFALWEAINPVAIFRKYSMNANGSLSLALNPHQPGGLTQNYFFSLFAIVKTSSTMNSRNKDKKGHRGDRWNLWFIKPALEEYVIINHWTPNP